MSGLLLTWKCTTAGCNKCLCDSLILCGYTAYTSLYSGKEVQMVTWGNQSAMCFLVASDRSKERANLPASETLCRMPFKTRRKDLSLVPEENTKCSQAKTTSTTSILPFELYLFFHMLPYDNALQNHNTLQPLFFFWLHFLELQFCWEHSGLNCFSSSRIILKK